MFKRVGSFVVTIAMLLTMVCTFSFASAADDVTLLGLTVKVDEVDAERGEIVTVTVGLENYVPVASLRIDGTYDSSVLELQEVAFASAAEEEAGEAPANYFPLDEYGLAIANTAEAGKIGVVIANKDNVELEAEEATLFVATFKVLDTAEYKAVAAVSFAFSEDDDAVAVWDPEATNEKFPDSEDVGAAVGQVAGEFYAADVVAVQVTVAGCDHVGYDRYIVYDGPNDTDVGVIAYFCTNCNEQASVEEIAAGAQYGDVDYKDANGNINWYYDAVAFGKAFGLLHKDGVGAGLYKPTSTVTRGQFAAVLSRMLMDDEAINEQYGNAEEDTLTDLKDATGNDEWFAPYARFMAEKGIIVGYTDNTFKGKREITRREAALMLYRFIKAAEFEESAFGSTAEYTDMDQIQWGVEEIEWCGKAGLFAGFDDGSFGADKPTRRSQMAVLLQRVYVVFENISLGGRA